MADYHRSKAAGLADQLDSSIYSDDPDAVERLEEKIAQMETRQAFMTGVNKICRNKKLDESGKVAQIVALGVDEEAAKKILHPEYHWQSVGFASFELTNNNANIRRCKKRLAGIKAAQELQNRASKAASGVVIDRFPNRGIARITFAEKPEREIIAALKAAGFYWCKGCWAGNVDKVPAEVIAIEGAAGE